MGRGWKTWSKWESLVQVQSLQCLWMYLCLKSQELNVLYLRKSIIIWSEVYICRSIDSNNLCNVVWIYAELLSSYPILQLNSGVSSIWIELLYQFINRVLKVPEQINPIFCFKNPRNKCCCQGIKFYNPFHHSRSIFKNAWESLWIEGSPESFTIWILRQMPSLFWNRGWWNINHKFFSSRGTARHLQKKHTHSKEPSAKPQDTNINLIRSKLVHEISTHCYLERHITQSW